MQDSRKPTLDEVAERSFGLAMRAARNRLHLSQTALAAELERRHGIKLDGTAITRIERRIHGNEGARAIRLGEAVAIASILELSLDDLVEPGMDQQLRDARLRLDAALTQAAAAQQSAAQARDHLEQLERMAEKHTHQVELEAELGVLQDEMYELQSQIDKLRSSDDQDGLTDLIDRLLEMSIEETRLATQLKDFVAGS